MHQHKNITCTSLKNNNESLSFISVEAIKKVEHIKTKRQNLYLAQRLRKAREVETARDIKAVQRDIAILNDPTEGRKFLFSLL